ncbi:isocitrate/isopropylmalate family dehydrogenase [Sphingomonas sp. GB1N7]|uniref:isocitrate/isopropylmalate family dehydrogenase n=1 Tax=Parasphingomonas caseinilytica TaxID=3096158 RepID=UPI002FC74312
MSTICVIPGEDAAAEAVWASVDLLKRAKVDVTWRWCETVAGVDGALSADAKALIDTSDATLFGATAGPAAAALFYLRWGKQTFANVRPTRWSAGQASPLRAPEGIDFVIVRENLEDAYVVLEGDLADLAPLGLVSRTARCAPEAMGPGNYAIKAITRAGSERVLRFGFELARKRCAQGYPGKLTASAKWNMQPATDGLFIATAKALAAEYPDVAFETLIVDDCAHRLVREPHRFDVLVLPNLYGDILSDAAAGLVGGLGVAASGCYGDDYAYFESAHGTAPDIAGQGVVNPTATLLSAALMLDYVEQETVATRLRNAIDAVYAAGQVLTRDMGGDAGTSAFCDAVLAAMETRS